MYINLYYRKDKRYQINDSILIFEVHKRIMLNFLKKPNRHYQWRLSSYRLWKVTSGAGGAVDARGGGGAGVVTQCDVSAPSAQ